MDVNCDFRCQTDVGDNPKNSRLTWNNYELQQLHAMCELGT